MILLGRRSASRFHSSLSAYLEISEPVKKALKEGRAVVALVSDFQAVLLSF
jgi:pseudouridine-5'-phosphate glycosidase